jgi:hypothetical protein
MSYGFIGNIPYTVMINPPRQIDKRNFGLHYKI